MIRHIAAVAIAIVTACAFLKADEPIPQKLAVPTAAAQEKPLQLITEIYRSDSQSAKTTIEKARLAKKLLQVGIDTSNDPVGRFVLFCRARDIAAEAGNSEIALTAIMEIDKRYAIDILPMEVEACTSIDKAAKTPKDCEGFVGQYMPVFQQALHGDQYQPATTIADCLLRSARKSGNTALIKEVVACRQQVDQLTKGFEHVADALKVLEQTPANPEANLIVGRFRCFLQGDWDRGLPHLALSSDEKLKALATCEISPPSDDDGQMKLGDDYWDLADTLKGADQQRLHERACHWYKIAFPTLNGLAKAKVEQRLKQMNLNSTAEAFDERRVRIDVRPIADFLRDAQKQFPPDANKARHGTASASSSYDVRVPERVFRGIRSGEDSWCMKGPRGWFRAIWSDPPSGRFILLFSRGTTKGNDAWGNSSIRVNGGAAIAMPDFSGSDVAIVDLRGQFNIREIELNIDGKDNPGIVGLEIH